MLYSGNNALMSQIVKQVTVLFFLWVMLDQSFAFSPLFVMRYKSIIKLNVGRFSLQYTLSCPPGTIPRICISFISLFPLLFVLPNVSDLHSILECTNPSRLDHDRSHPPKRGSWHFSIQSFILPLTTRQVLFLKRKCCNVFRSARPGTDEVRRQLYWSKVGEEWVGMDSKDHIHDAKFNTQSCSFYHNYQQGL